jgi:hypothetical protein
MSGRLTRIHVNQHIIKANQKVIRESEEDGLTRIIQPVLTVKDYKDNRRGFQAVIGDGDVRVVYSPLKPLPCGATVWIETRLPVEVTT